MSNSIPNPEGTSGGARRWRRALFVLVALITLIALFYAEENWRGKRAWEKYKAELIAQGEWYEWKPFPPSKIPDDQNFTKTPLLKAIGTKQKLDTNVWARFERVEIHRMVAFIGERGQFTDLKACQDYLRSSTNYSLPPLPRAPAEDLVSSLRAVEADLNELRQASHRPYAEFAVEGNDPVTIDIPNFVAARTFTQMFCLHSSAQLALGHPEAAFADQFAVHRLASACATHPTLVSAMIRVAIMSMSTGPFWEGLASGQWSDQQLEEFQKSFHAAELMRAVSDAIRIAEGSGINYIAEHYTIQQFAGIFRLPGGRRTWNDKAADLLFALFPRGWIRQNQIVYNRAMQFARAGFDGKSGRIDPKKCVWGSESLAELVGRRGPFYLLSGIAVPNFAKAYQTTALHQSSMHQAELACALERFRRKQGQYPETLQALTPQFIEKLPLDLITGEPPKYRRTPEGKYLLYSVGWNEKDDGGTSGKDRIMDGDWVWPFPEKK